MSSDHGEPYSKRRRLEGGQNAAQQHFGSYSDTSGFMLQCFGSHASSSSHAAPSTQFPGMVTSCQFQQSIQAASQMHLVGTESTSHRPFGMTQLWETQRAPNTQDQSAWGQMQHFAPTHAPNHGHASLYPATMRPTAILPMPEHLQSRGVHPLLVPNYYPLPIETTAIPFTSQPAIHQGSPSTGPLPGNVLSTGIAEVDIETADSSGEETVCFGMVGFNYDF